LNPSLSAARSKAFSDEAVEAVALAQRMPMCLMSWGNFCLMTLKAVRG